MASIECPECGSKDVSQCYRTSKELGELLTYLVCEICNHRSVYNKLSNFSSSNVIKRWKTYE